MIRLYIIALAALGLMCLAAVFMVPGANSAAPVAVVSSKPVIKAETDALMLRRDGSGQFHVDAAVNGNSVNFLVDTGADLVALTEEQAADIGLNLDPDDFQPVMQTASGVGYGAQVTLDEVEIGGASLSNVQAVVVRGLTVNLLGQSVLKQLGAVELKGDTMVIRTRGVAGD